MTRQFRRPLLFAFIALTLAVCLHPALAHSLRERRWLSFFAGLTLVILSAALLAHRLAPSIRLGNTNTGLFRDLALSFGFMLIIAWPLVSHVYTAPSTLKMTALAFNRQDGIIAAIKNARGLFETYWQNACPPPSWYLPLNGFIKVHLFGISPDERVIVGENGFFYEGAGQRMTDRGQSEYLDVVADYLGQRPFTTAELRQWKIALEQRAWWLRRLGCDYVFILAPDKALVYPEYLPKRLRPQHFPVRRYQQLASYLRRYADVHFIDLLPPLAATKKQQPEPPLFYKTDFHWNTYGAFIAYLHMNETLAAMFPGHIQHRPRPSDFILVPRRDWSSSRFMDMLQLPKSLYIRENGYMLRPRCGTIYGHIIGRPSPFIYDGIQARAKSVATKNGEITVNLLENPAAALDEIVLLGDSFLEKCLYFFAADAKRLIYHRAVAHFPAALLETEKPSLVAQEALAMYLLRRPPDNPPPVAAGYFARKFRDHADKSVFVAEKIGQENQTAAVFSLRGMPPQREGEVRVACLRITEAAQAGERIVATLIGEDGKPRHSMTIEVEPGDSAIFFAAPIDQAAALRFHRENGGAPFFHSLEFRSDLKPRQSAVAKTEDNTAATNADDSLSPKIGDPP
ncbi:MAG: hypothetical protein LBU39_06310 [Desulfobulbaceae bacterium]|jgi:hypothetical protein|nr:hypothetical protein [Desulfobulbaceae bacterium]